MAENSLAQSKSLYLQKHANNTINWKIWGQEALLEGKQQNKLMIVSIGYASCHWCHVMEKECFSDPQVGQFMNEHFISIKIDREERPDLDMVYMNAVNLMQNSGGWPLNCICLPDTRPVYGGTYYNKNDWLALMANIQNLWLSSPKKLYDFADKLQNGLAEIHVFDTLIKKNELQSAFHHQLAGKWVAWIDPIYGGENQAPKFPMMQQWIYLNRLCFLLKDEALKEKIILTLKYLTNSGIYDLVEGGIFRYSTDRQWFIPHFEKMLYDNAQLISLLSETYQHFKIPSLYNKLFKTIEFLTQQMCQSFCSLKEMKANIAIYYPIDQKESTIYGTVYHSSIDADSEGIEGKYYCWHERELKTIWGENYDFLKCYFSCTENGNFKDLKTNILYPSSESKNILLRFNLDEKKASQIIDSNLLKLKEWRVKKIKPEKDNKKILSWNALLLEGFVDAFKSTGEENFKTQAKLLVNGIQYYFTNSRGQYQRLGKQELGQHQIFLDDYSYLIKAFIKVYHLDYKDEFLHEAYRLTKLVLKKYFNPKKNVFHFTPIAEKKLFSNMIEITDNVCPSSNAIMSYNLFILGVVFADTQIIQIAKSMFQVCHNRILQHPNFHAAWLQSNLMGIYPQLFVVYRLAQSKELLKAKIFMDYHPEIFFLNASSTQLPITKDKFKKNEYGFFVCTGNTCSAGMKDIEVLEQYIEKCNKQFKATRK